MAVSNGLATAYRSQDLAFSAWAAYWHTVDPAVTGSKLSDSQAEILVKLSSELREWQERIRIHRNKPLPGTARPGGGKRAGKLERRPAQVGAGLPEPPKVSIPDPSPSESEGEQGEHHLQSFEGDEQG